MPRFRTRKILIGSVVAVLLLWVWARWGPMDPLFSVPTSTVLFDRNGVLLGAIVADDGQWRMPAMDSLPARFETCLLRFEDRNFRSHFGIHLPSLVRAAQQNFRAGRTISGGSTITMQLARMSRINGKRSYANKLLEALLALRLEARWSKDEILMSYAANAPFGGNVVGLEAAAWRWFERDPWELSWAESATLAVLPNSPAKIHPGRSRAALLRKRNTLLDGLLSMGALDSLSWSLAIEEPLPDAPKPLPRGASHLLTTLHGNGYKGKRIQSTLDVQLQRRATALAEQQALLLRANEVHNAAVLIMEVTTGEVLAYVGNLPSAGREHAGDVDIVHAARSTGSLLKPFLYAAMIHQGERMPQQLVADLPTRYQGFAPRNYDERFSGSVHFGDALARSLNVPAVRALHEHGVERTLRVLRAMGLDHLDRPADHYGSALIVGGSESTLWELTGAYSSMARIVRAGTQATANEINAPRIISEKGPLPKRIGPPVLGAAALFHTLQALQSMDRPDVIPGMAAANSGTIAWKTGTSFGHRDAWAIGVNDQFAVGVWTGNASGEGRPALTGTLAAAPLLFELFDLLPDGQAFDPPYDHMQRMAVCTRSGHRANSDCSAVDSLWMPIQCLRTPLCPYHTYILVDKNTGLRTTPGPEAERVLWFSLPPAMERYTMAIDPAYTPLPAWTLGMGIESDDGTMEMIYPNSGTRILVPVQLNGSYGQVVLEAAHRDKTARIHWDLNGSYLGTTIGEHSLSVELEAGKQDLTLTDHVGRNLQTTFSVERGKKERP